MSRNRVRFTLITLAPSKRSLALARTPFCRPFDQGLVLLHRAYPATWSYLWNTSVEIRGYIVPQYISAEGSFVELISSLGSRMRSGRRSPCCSHLRPMAWPPAVGPSAADDQIHLRVFVSPGGATSGIIAYWRCKDPGFFAGVDALHQPLNHLVPRLAARRRRKPSMTSRRHMPNVFVLDCRDEVSTRDWREIFACANLPVNDSSGRSQLIGPCKRMAPRRLGHCRACAQTAKV